MENIDLGKEECIICFNETDNFMIFTCKHKSCHKCLPRLLQYSNKCPICEKDIVQIIDMPYVIIPQNQTIYDMNTQNNVQCFKIFCIFVVIGFIIFYIINIIS
jgi:hypothetical protein